MTVEFASAPTWVPRVANRSDAAREVTVARARVALRASLPGLQARRIGVIHGGVSAEDRLNAERFPPQEWSLSAILHTMATLGLTAVHLDPTDAGFVQALTRQDLISRTPTRKNGR